MGAQIKPGLYKLYHTRFISYTSKVLWMFLSSQRFWGFCLGFGGCFFQQYFSQLQIFFLCKPLILQTGKQNKKNTIVRGNTEI